MTTAARASADVGLIGLAVMGENLALNIERNGFPITVYNRSTDKTEALLAGRAKGLKFTGAKTVQELVASLERPRRIILLVKAGAPVRSAIWPCRYLSKRPRRHGATEKNKRLDGLVSDRWDFAQSRTISVAPCLIVT